MADITKIGATGESQIFHYNSEDGDSGTRFVIWRWSWKKDEEAPTDEIIDEWVADNFPASRCHHAHDCCGHWYDGTADWHDITEKYLRDSERLIVIRQSSAQNI